MTKITIYETEFMTPNPGQGRKMNKNYFSGTDG